MKKLILIEYILFQQELEKYSRDKSHNGVHSNLECETLRNNLEMQLEDTMCKLIRTEEDMSPLPKQVTEKNNSSIEEYMHYYQSSMENYSKQKEQEVENLKYAFKFHGSRFYLFTSTL